MSPTTSIPSSSAASGGAASSATSTDTATPTKQMFLQLLVAQIKNQDPMNPTDGVQFLTQLAQFSALEQSISLNATATAMQGDLDKLVAAAPQTGTTAP